jgi:hypothetical protein
MCRELGGEDRSRLVLVSPVVATMLLPLLGGEGIPRAMLGHRNHEP